MPDNPQLADQIEEARRQGYGDDEIVNHIKSARGDLSPKIDEALRNGYSLIDIIGHLKGMGTPTPAVEAAMPQGSFGQTLSGFLPGKEFLPDFVRGAFNRAKGYVAGAENLVHKAVPLLIPTISGKPYQPWDLGSSEFAPPPTTAGTLGSLATDVGAFAFPTKITGALPTGSRLLSPEMALQAAKEGAGAASVEAVRSGGDVDKMATTGLVGAAAPVVSKLASNTLRGLSQWLGSSTRAGETGIQRAATTAESRFKSAMANRTTEMEIAQDVKDAVGKVAQGRIDRYRSSFPEVEQNYAASLSQGGKPLSKDPINKEFIQQATNFGASMFAGKKLYGLKGKVLHSQGDTFWRAHPDDLKLLQDTFSNIQAHSDLSPRGLDDLKQYVYAQAQRATTGKAQAFLNRVGSAATNELNQKVPGYRALTADYAKTKQLEDMISSELSVQNQNPGVMIRKLSYALNQNNDYRKYLLEALDKEAGTHLVDTLAGYSLRSTLPRGLSGALTSSLPGALAVGAGFTHHPILATGLALMSSPRAVGETLAMISALRRTPEVNAMMKFPARTLLPAAVSSGQVQIPEDIANQVALPQR